MRKFKKPILAAGIGASMLAAGAIQPAVAEVGFGKPGEAVKALSSTDSSRGRSISQRVLT